MLRLEAERRIKGFTLARLGEAAKLHISDLSRFENGRARPYPKQLARLAAALQVQPPEALLEEIATS
jgi:transcriptional regulator with XRE-family HTH domain